MDMNNLSKVLFKEFLNITKLDRGKGNRQVVNFNGDKWQFSISTKERLECRQLYEDCKGFITFHLPTSNVYICEVDDISNYVWSRTMKDGTKAFSVEKPISHGMLWETVNG